MSLLSKTRGIASELGRLFGPPVMDTMILFITDRCNLRCAFCCNLTVNSSDRARELSLDEVCTLVGGLTNPRSITFSGGEPFIRDDFGDILIALHERCGIPVINIPTNGALTAVIGREVDRVLTQCPNLTLSINVSLDGPEALHDAGRGVEGTSRRARETIRILGSLKSRHPGISIKVSSLITQDNHEVFEPFLDDLMTGMPELDGIGITLIREQHHAKTFEGYPALWPLCMRLTKKITAFYDAKNQVTYRRRLTMPRFLNRMATTGVQLYLPEVARRVCDGGLWPFPCVAGKKGVVITADGQLRACEIRPPILNLRDYGCDLAAAVASPAFQAEVAAIACDQCDCVHGCFISWSLNASPRHMLGSVPRAYVRSKRGGAV